MGEDAPTLVFLLSPEVGIPTEVLPWGKKNKKKKGRINAYVTFKMFPFYIFFALFPIKRTKNVKFKFMQIAVPN